MQQIEGLLFTEFNKISGKIKDGEWCIMCRCLFVAVRSEVNMIILGDHSIVWHEVIGRMFAHTHTHTNSHTQTHTHKLTHTNSHTNIDRNMFFSVKEGRRTRGHGVTLAKKQCRLDIRRFSFSQKQ